MGVGTSGSQTDSELRPITGRSGRRSKRGVRTFETRVVVNSASRAVMAGSGSRTRFRRGAIRAEVGVSNYSYARQGVDVRVTAMLSVRDARGMPLPVWQVLRTDAWSRLCAWRARSNARVAGSVGVSGCDGWLRTFGAVRNAVASACVL